MRKSPIRHKVKQHVRKRRSVQSYMRGQGQTRVVVKRRVIRKYQIPKTVVLWHGSPVENKDLILKHGIQYRKPQVETMVAKAVKEIRIETEVKDFHTDGYVRDRIRESTEKGGIVYLSASQEYAMQNALAGKEWYQSLLINALNKKYAGMLEYRRRLASKHLKLQREMDVFRKKKSQALNKGDYKEYKRLREEEKKTEDEYREAGRKYSEYNKKVQALRRKTQDKLVVRKAVIFRIEIPYMDFKKMLGDDYSRSRVKDFESLRESGFFDDPKYKLAKGVTPFEDFFGEIHLKHVPTKYIKSYGVFTHERYGKYMGEIAEKTRMQKVR